MDFLEVQNVYFRYKNQQGWALQDVSLHIHKDEAVGLIGHNGSGKTTLTKLLIGALKVTGGKILLQGRDINGLSLAQVGRQIGYLFQNPDKQLFATTVEGEIRFGLKNLDLPETEIQQRVNHYLTYFNMEHHRQDYPLHLSQGEKQRLVLASILAMQPQYLIFDEPTVGLDTYHCRQLEKILKDLKHQQVGMIISSHDRSFLERIADCFITMEGGRVIADAGNGV